MNVRIDLEKYAWRHRVEEDTLLTEALTSRKGKSIAYVESIQETCKRTKPEAPGNESPAQEYREVWSGDESG